MRTIDTELSLHPLAYVFPAMSQADYEELRDDIARNGQIDPIWLFDGQIVDGRHRYRACRELGLPVKARDYDGDDPAALVKSNNLLRRHMDAGQRALAAARMADWYAGQAKARMSEGGKHKGKQGDAEGKEKIPSLPGCKQARDQAGEDFGVSGRYVEDAVKLLSNAVPELIALVDEGRLKLTLAREVAKLKPGIQHEVLALGEPHLIRAATKKKQVLSETGKRRQEKLRRERAERSSESEASSGQAPPSPADPPALSTAQELLYGLERLAATVKRIDKPEEAVLSEWQREMENADELSLNRWASVREIARLAGKLEERLSRVSLRVVK